MALQFNRIVLLYACTRLTYSLYHALEAENMRKTINMLGWIGVTLTMFAMIFTMISTYHFRYIEYFYNYYTLEWCLFFTMIFWGIKMFHYRSGIKDLVYTIICFLMAFGCMFFRFMKVY